MCVGLDSDFSKVPEVIHNMTAKQYKKGSAAYGALITFNRAIVDATYNVVCAYKPNNAFYEKNGEQGIEALRNTISEIHRCAPDVPVILDYKRGDIGNTNDGYLAAAFDYCQADAVTVHPYLGEEALRPFLAREDKVIFVLCRTSNPGAGEFQDLQVDNPYPDTGAGDKIHLYQHVALRVARHWNTKGNCGLVVGATYPTELSEVRVLVSDLPILIPGIGAQGGDLEASVRAGMDSQKMGFIINSSRGIIFASSSEDFAEAARRETIKLHEAINKVRLAT